MPNTENITLWVEALRSGEYTQGMGALHNPERNTFCCLGVACDVARKNGVKMVITAAEGGVTNYDDEAAVLPPSVREWLGLDCDNPVLGEHRATELNDCYDVSLGGIADLVVSTFLPPGRLCTRLISSLAASAISARRCLILS